jgi:hypothetical protein
MASRSLIESLFSLRCPAAIVGFVIPVFVRPAVECLVGWTLSHVGKKIGEDQPSVTYRDPSTAVMLPPVSGGVSAASPHRQPTGIGWRKPFFARTVTVLWRRPSVVVMPASGHDGSSMSGCVKKRLVVCAAGRFAILAQESASA